MIEQRLRGLKAGDVVTYEGREWLVRGTLRSEQDGTTWESHLLADGPEQRWLGLDDDDGLVVTVWRRVPLAEVDGRAGDREVRTGGAVYRLYEEGEAAFRAEGVTGTAPSGTNHYLDYRGATGARLSFEHLGGEWEASLGLVVAPRLLRVAPAVEVDGVGAAGVEG